MSSGALVWSVLFIEPNGLAPSGFLFRPTYGIAVTLREVEALGNVQPQSAVLSFILRPTLFAPMSTIVSGRCDHRYFASLGCGAQRIRHCAVVRRAAHATAKRRSYSVCRAAHAAVPATPFSFCAGPSDLDARVPRLAVVRTGLRKEVLSAAELHLRSDVVAVSLSWIVARMCGATVQDQVETPAAVRIRALGTDLLILVIDVEGIRKFSSAPHLFGRIVTLEVPWIFHTFQGGLRTAADLKCGPRRSGPGSSVVLLVVEITIQYQIDAPRCLGICASGANLSALMVDVEGIRIFPRAPELFGGAVAMDRPRSVHALHVRVQAAPNGHLRFASHAAPGFRVPCALASQD
mmetsp:Transcript_14045/g.31075  ORF Transcript_14045/g.31075 Transcript_14045/m.31075 type:complete len:349 (+) Transcript_14045:1918-2964(+)